MGTWNVTSLRGKEPELVREVERYRLEIVGPASMHSLGPGTELLKRGWTLFYSGAHGERRRAGVGLLIAPRLSCHVLEFTPVNERVVSLHLRVGDRTLQVISAINSLWVALIAFPFDLRSKTLFLMVCKRCGNNC